MSPFLFLFFLIQCFGLSMSIPPGPGVTLRTQPKHVVIDNGILQVTISTPDGIVTEIRYNDIDNLLAIDNPEDLRGYWDQTWEDPQKHGGLDRILSTNWTIVTHNTEQVELSFVRTWNPSLVGRVPPINIDKRFVMLHGSSGFYCYSIHERLPTWPAVSISNTRMAFKLNKDRFHYMAISDNRQRSMPLPADREQGRGIPLEYPEAVLLVNPIEHEFKGEVDDKYQYSKEASEIRVHGWISTNPAVGFWQITPSHESHAFGPLKQFLTSHVGPTSLTTFHSPHYLGERYAINFRENEKWKKVYGPFFVYVNSIRGKTLDDKQIIQELWQDANRQYLAEVKSWPYNFPASKDFAKSQQRGSVSGRLVVRDSGKLILAKGAYVGLAAPGEAGSWEKEAKGYQFWTIAGPDGGFFINNVLIGEYNLYAWVPGFIGDYKYEISIKITPGSAAKLGNIVYKPPRDGPTFWEIGIPDRSAAEFHVPAPIPSLTNKLYANFDCFRQYGIWSRYAELYPKGDLIYTPGVSDYKTDWYYAQNTRKKNNTGYVGTTWQIKFKLETLNSKAIYKLRVAVASANTAELQVRVNDPLASRPPLLSTGMIGEENAIARHGIHGAYLLFNVDVPGSILLPGDNTVFLTQTRTYGPFVGIMYDYIRFEGPPI